MILLALLVGQAWAAACCGGAFSTPSLILNDDRSQITASYYATKIDADVDEQGLATKRIDAQSVDILKLEGASLIGDRFQVGLQIPFQENQRFNPGHSPMERGFGDLQVDVAYEFLPEWSYSAWRPRGFLFLEGTIPSGKSVYESANAESLDVTGKGVYALGLGAAFVKIFGRWDVELVSEIHRGFKRAVFDPVERVRAIVHPGWGSVSTLGGGFNLENWRFGASAVWSFEDAISVEETIPLRVTPERYTTLALSAAYLFSDQWAASISVSSSEWVGQPTNTTLSNSVLVSVQRRWPR